MTIQDRDLRSLERRSMYSIFAPLDPDERLPRELILEAKRARQIGRRELAGAMWLPLLFAILVLTGWGGIGPPVALGLIAAAFAGLCLYVVLGERAAR